MALIKKLPYLAIAEIKKEHVTGYFYIVSDVHFCEIIHAITLAVGVHPDRFIEESHDKWLRYYINEVMFGGITKMVWIFPNTFTQRRLKYARKTFNVFEESGVKQIVYLVK